MPQIWKYCFGIGMAGYYYCTGRLQLSMEVLDLDAAFTTIFSPLCSIGEDRVTDGFNGENSHSLRNKLLVPVTCPDITVW